MVQSLMLFQESFPVVQPVGTPPPPLMFMYLEVIGTTVGTVAKIVPSDPPDFISNWVRRYKN